MRFFVIVAALGTASLANAEPPRPVIWKNRVVKAPPSTSGFAAVSHVLYLNDCRAGRCAVSPGNDNSLTNRSSIPESAVTLPAYPYSQAHWDQLVACVRETFQPFDIKIVTEDPGTASHFEVMIGGSSEDLHPQLQAGGVAPLLACGATENNVISFVFPETTNNLNFLCGAVAQEACHVWGLDHELNAKDPMTYLELGSLKRFQDDNAKCGEDLGDPRSCECGGPTQNSYKYMMDTFGPANLAPASILITSPVEGQWVKPGFTVRADLESQLSGKTGALSIDGSQVASSVAEPYVWQAPSALAGGTHAVGVSVTDSGNRTVSTSVTVNVTATCSDGGDCEKSFHCLGGFCLPGANVGGGLGATCTTNDDCITGSCGSDGTDSRCTGACDAGMTCPSGFACVAAGGTGVCWPSESGGGCTSSSGGSPALLGVGLGLLAISRRRRRGR